LGSFAALLSGRDADVVEFWKLTEDFKRKGDDL